METVDSVDKIREAVWCDHVKAGGVWYFGGRVLKVWNAPINIVIEEGKVKLLCDACYYDGLQIRLPYTSQ